MPITIRDKQFERRMARVAKRRGNISLTAVVKSLASEQADVIERESKSAERYANQQAQQPEAVAG